MWGSVGWDGIDCNPNGTRNREAVSYFVERRAKNVEGVRGSTMQYVRGRVERYGVKWKLNGSCDWGLIDRRFARRAMQLEGSPIN